MSVLAIKKMMLYCPKCQKKYEESDLRFCNNDGARLVPAKFAGNQTQGVFTSILGLPTPIGKNEEEQSVPTFIKTNGESSAKQTPNPAGFFKLDAKPESQKTSTRVVKPSEIPTGQAALGDRQTNPAGRDALTLENPEVLIGQLIKGRYKILKITERSESGISFLAADKIAADRKVIVTVLMGDKDDVDEKLFAEERKSLSLINHPNVERLLDSGELLEGKPFVIREFYDGVSVGDLLEKSGQFDSLRTARIIRQAAYALGAIHQNHVIHRRLQPENIILIVGENDSEQVKLVNTGLFDEEINKDNLAYKSPEQLSGKAESFAEDTYSLAVIAYQMLTNRLPFDASSINALLKSQREGLTVHPTNLRLDVQPIVDDILEKALSFDSAKRYPKAHDFGNVFYNALTSVAPWEEEKKDVKTEISETKVPEIKMETADGEILEIEQSEIENLEDFSKILETENIGRQEILENDEKSEKIPMPYISLIPEKKVDIKGEIPAIEKDDADKFAGEIQEVEIKDISLEKADAENLSDEHFAQIAASENAADKDLLWEKRSPEKPKNADSRSTFLPLIGVLILLAAGFGFWYYFINRPTPPLVQTSEPTVADAAAANQKKSLPNAIDGYSPNNEDIEIPPPERQVSQPPETKYFENTKQNLKDDLARNFLGFSLFYPQDWNLNQTDNKFIDLSKNTKGNLPEKVFLVSPYDSRGTFKMDEPLFSELVKKSNSDLAKDVPNYQVISEGNVAIQNGRWKAYEVKFQGGGEAGKGEKKLILWGRRLWIPVQRPGMKNGFIITMFATSLSDDVTSVDDVGVKDSLAKILETFEPTQN